MDQDRFIELAPDYALGLLEGQELEEFEAHLASGCEACELELGRMDAVGDALAYAVPLAPAPAGLRERVLLAVEAESQSQKREARPATPPRVVPEKTPSYSAGPWPATAPAASEPRRGGFLGGLAPALAFAGLLVGVVSGVYALKLRNQLTLVRADLERVQAENQELARVMDVVSSPRLRLVALGGQAGSPNAEGRVLWSPDAKKAVLYASGLPRPPAGRDYQLWVIEGDTPRSEGVFPVDQAGSARHVLPEVPAAAGVGAFAVTIEPAGGVPSPTGPMVLLGSVN